MIVWKKKLAAAALAAVLTFSVSATVFAHDGWTQTNAPIIAQGEVAYVDMLFGNHSNDHKSYRITGQWGVDSSKVYVTSPAGVKTDITSTRFYTGEAATETEPAVNNGFVASFSAASPGAYIVTGESDSVSTTSLSRSLRSAKSFVAISDLPLISRVSALKGFANPVSLDRAEFVPQFNPAAAVPGQDVKVQLLLKGKPVADTEVSLIRRSNSEGQTLTTDDNGFVTYKTGAADYYLLRASTSTEESKEGEYTKVNYTATMTYTVQNAGVKLPAGKASPIPYVYVDGKLVSSDSLTIVKGSTNASADFLKQYIDPSYSSKNAASLRQTAEKAGAVVEFLPAVGDTRAAVLIYTKK
ncbi:DUF4198 domain-containing protein [Paenibacillus sp. FSL H8-0537]|uniref:DUF4198 domain-containing protein n=1 Tax=Paenibacillus sp. FSL H8-0537 TaxID=2921399 RepID=UPI0031017D30